MLTRCRRIAAFAFGCGMVSLVASTAQSQQIITLKNFSTKGEFVRMAGPYMDCILDGTPVAVQFDKNAKIKVTGTATADFLGPGMYVQFKGTFDRHGKGTELIKELELFTPDKNNQPGAYPAGGGNAFDEPTPGKKRGPPPATTMYSIAGRITAAHNNAHNNTITIDCGNMRVKAEIAPDAAIKLDTTDPSWASSGDHVTISGAILGPGRALGQNVSIELAKPLEGRKHRAHFVEKAADKAKTDDKSKPADKTAKTTDKAKTAKGDTIDKADKKVADPKAVGPKATDPKAIDPKATDPKAGDPTAAGKTAPDKSL